MGVSFNFAEGSDDAIKYLNIAIRLNPFPHFGHPEEMGRSYLLKGHYEVGSDLTIDEGYAAAQRVALILLASLKSEIGDLDRVRRVVKLLGMINCTPDFTDQPKVINGASDLLVDLYGDKGRHARSAVGMNSLPSNIVVEIEMIQTIRMN